MARAQEAFSDLIKSPGLASLTVRQHLARYPFCRYDQYLPPPRDFHLTAGGRSLQ